MGVLIGAVVGVVLFYVLYFIGYITALTAILAILLGVTLYRKFGGKPNKVMIIMAFATTLITQLIAIFSVYVLVANALSLEQGLVHTGLDAFKYYWNMLPEFKSEFLSNFLMTFVFTAIGLVLQISYAKKLVQRTKKLD